MSVARYIVAGLGAAASVSAAPYAQEGQYSAPSSTLSTAYVSASASASYTASAPSVNPAVPTIVQPSAPPANPAAASSAAAAAASLAREAVLDVTNVQRFNTVLTVDGAGQQLLPPDQLRERTVFDFGARAAPLGQGGRFVLANENNFPILVEQGIATAIGFLNPCSMNSPHTHPRATEWLTVVQGKLQSGFMLENGFLANAAIGQLTTQIPTELHAFQGTVFPQGSIHYQFNNECEPATFIATLNNADPGTSQVAQNFFFQDEKIVNITLGEINNIDGSNIEQFRKTLPANLVQAVDSCLAKCEKKDH
ncbi:hypothetical protein PRZ48_011071 [Zasmidium cellare]|uniref:Cupin type-1 domain-containing protein n=1 Tax=Zasmidium cellare TaxID=395010 RepID=A0ABR0EBI4_ZASCE|nr:hypothetical protein PRZ48_011071 [Zasmidium cellare]